MCLIFMSSFLLCKDYICRFDYVFEFPLFYTYSILLLFIIISSHLLTNSKQNEYYHSRDTNCKSVGKRKNLIRKSLFVSCQILQQNWHWEILIFSGTFFRVYYIKCFFFDFLSGFCFFFLHCKLNMGLIYSG